jgi:hypothetical protein
MAIDEQKVLADLKAEIERLKRDVAVKEGERNSILQRIKKDFDVSDLDSAYTKLKELGNDIEIKKERRDELLKEAQDKLKSYRR